MANSSLIFLASLTLVYLAFNNVSAAYINPGLINPYDGADGDYFGDFGIGADRWKWWCWGRWWYRTEPSGCHDDFPITGLLGYDADGYGCGSDGYACVNVSSVPHDIFPRWWFCAGHWWYGRKPYDCQTTLTAPESYYRAKRHVGNHRDPSSTHGDKRWWCWGRWWYRQQPNNCHQDPPTTGLCGYDPYGYARVNALSVPHDINPRWWFCWGKWWYGSMPRGCQTKLQSPAWGHNVYDYDPVKLTTEPCSLHFYPQPMTWQEASNFCVKNGMHLANLKTQYEQELAATTYGAAEPFWIGATDEGHEGQWQWMDTTPIGATASWLPGKPNGGVVQNCAQTNWRQPGKWDDVECSEKKPFLCQIC